MRLVVGLTTKNSAMKAPYLEPFFLPKILAKPCFFIWVCQKKKSHRLTQAHDGAIDTGKTLATAGARPMSDPRDFEKTLNAPHSDLSATLGLRSAVQNKAGAHQLALSAHFGCPIAKSAPNSDFITQAQDGAIAPSSLLFCGVRNTHNFLAICKFSEEFGQCPSPS